MKDFFTNMNFPRAVIVVSFVASAALGWLLWTSTDRLVEVEGQKAGIKREIRVIQELALRLDGLQRLASDSVVVTDSNKYVLYVTETAMSKHVSIGQVQTDPSTTNPVAGIEDRHLKIRPAGRDAAFQRANIGNFLYKLESDSNNRVRITNIKMTPEEKLRPGEIGNDLWKFEAEITARQSVVQS